MVDALRRRAGEENWEQIHGARASRELQEQWNAIDDQIIAATNAYFEREFNSGRAELLEVDSPVLIELRSNPLIIQRVQYEQGSAYAKRVELPITGFEDLYAQREFSIWLLSRSRNGVIAGAPPD